MNPVQEYLRLSSAYCGFLGGIRWSSQDDTLVYGSDKTFAFTEEIAAFLAGFGRTRPLIHFGHVLHLLDLLRNNRRLPAPEVVRLHRAFTEAAGTFANAGVFFAHVCRNLPSVPLAVDALEVRDRLRNPAMPIRWFLVSFHDTFHPAERAPLEPEAFEQVVLRGIAPYRDDELRHWFRHGRGAVKDAGAEVARQLPVPRTLTGVLAALLERPRLAGAQAFVAQLVSALTLPPRRLAHQELPIGGYADVTTHGPVDQILPSQFALDEWDFFRRFAERELLYFRREEPPARTRQELVVLLDQGVRTWGDVRLVLSAAALAFGKQAARRGTPFFLAATSQGGDLVDPLEAPGEALGRLVEASDLSPHPGLALEKVLEQHAQGARDVVLLTHPRNLHETDVSSAARRVAPGVRLFAVAMEATGRVELAEMRHGVAVPLRHFQLAYPPPTPAPAEPEKRAEQPGGWSGDVERIGYPFRFGLSSPITHFDFDYAGEWLVTASQDGMMHAWRVDGSEREVLPRGAWQNTVLARPEVVQGVAGGFVIVGRIRSQAVVFHYDFARRTCTAHTMGGPKTKCMDWNYSRPHHTMFALFALGHRSGTLLALDLTTGCVSSTENPNPSHRAGEFWHDWATGRLQTSRLWCPNTLPRQEKVRPFCYLDRDTGELLVQGLMSAWKSFTPMADGRPMLKGWLALEAQYCHQTLALTATRLGKDSEFVLKLFRGPEGTSLGEYGIGRPKMGFVLSADGKCLARLVRECYVQVNSAEGNNTVLVGTHVGGFSPKVQFFLSEGWLILATGKSHQHLIRWDRGPLELLHRCDKHAPLTLDAFYKERRDKPLRLTGAEATWEEIPALAGYDHQRFILGATTDVTAVADRFGQIAIFDCDGQLLCMFFVFRDRIAAWMPNGTRHGPPSLIAGPPTPDALTRIGQALRQACERGRKRS
jgi:MoxR-vWA-beta-propeller ternary system domain bpX1